MVCLIVIHVLSAILGLGPAYAFPFILRKASTAEEMKRNLTQVAYLEIFPKIFGTMAILSGLLLFFLGSYGPFAQVWIIGSLAVYVVIEILIIGLLNPTANKLLKLINETGAAALEEPAAHLIGLYARVRNLHLWAGILGLVIFIFMIVKPD
ncbi:hypothetical protein PCCS19_27520 [Paenibacillus sp. CCS19]|uniref:DUF2269 family protein n=1 Tax=Paenibacillus sp. CCS19 TaxID=3158387 RepID=UPI00255F4BCA|nr:DUF2269 family protein [Paenibacillus cellulosilyticus]GMK39697.1 hypothetical protein PCCS19_27520 [Paenibacillus cellulosilyticus]